MRKLGVVVAALAVLLAGACGEDDEGTTSPPGTEAPTTQPEAKATVLSVEASEPAPGAYAFAGVPATVTGGLVEINLRNTGKEGHELQLLRIDPGHSVEELRKELDGPEGAPTPAWVHFAAGAGSVTAGQSTTSKVLLEPGQYAFACFIPDANEVSHFKNGMFGTFTVAGGTGAAALPPTETTITAREHSFEVPALKAGRSTITFANAGNEPHHALMFPIAPGKTPDDVRVFFSSQGPPTGPPPVDFERGTGTEGIDGGKSYVAEVNLSPGQYVFVCFFNDRAGGPPHVANGMLQVVTVT